MNVTSEYQAKLVELRENHAIETLNVIFVKQSRNINEESVLLATIEGNFFRRDLRNQNPR